MGKAARWFRNLLGLKKEKEQLEYVEKSNALPVDIKEKKRRSFVKLGKDTCSQGKVSCDLPLHKTVYNTDREKCCSADTERDQNKHAIAVAAATAAAADAAVAAAQAAVAVVRLTSNGRGTLFNGGREKFAAMRIQSVFRGYLARKALRALRALVKLQALVRGYLVRKRAAATLYSMHALIRAQTAVRSQRARRSFSKESRIHPEIRARRSVGCFDDTRNKYHSKRMSTSSESPYSTWDESPKIVEIDTVKPCSSTRRVNTAVSEFGEDLSYQDSSSLLPCPNKTPISECYQYHDFEWSFTGDECRFSTAQNTPRFANYASSMSSVAPMTPSKSVNGDSYFRPCANYPNYMSNTQSFKAKLRSLSAPKQRPGPGTKKRLSLAEMMAARNSISGVRIQKSSIAEFEETRINEM